MVFVSCLPFPTLTPLLKIVPNENMANSLTGRKQRDSLSRHAETVRLNFCAKLDREIKYNNVRYSTTLHSGLESERYFVNMHTFTQARAAAAVAAAVGAIPVVPSNCVECVYTSPYALRVNELVGRNVEGTTCPINLVQPYDNAMEESSLVLFVPWVVTHLQAPLYHTTTFDQTPYITRGLMAPVPGPGGGIPYGYQVDPVFFSSVEAFKRHVRVGPTAQRVDSNVVPVEVGCLSRAAKFFDTVLFTRSGFQVRPENLYFHVSYSRPMDLDGPTRGFMPVNAPGMNRAIIDPLVTTGTLFGYNFFDTRSVLDENMRVQVVSTMIIQGDFQPVGVACGPYSLGMKMEYCSYGMTEQSVFCACKHLGVRFMYWWGTGLGTCMHDGNSMYRFGERIVVYFGAMENGPVGGRFAPSAKYHVISGVVTTSFDLLGGFIGESYSINFIDPCTDRTINISALKARAAIGPLVPNIGNSQTAARWQTTTSRGVHRARTDATARLGPCMFLIDGIENIVDGGLPFASPAGVVPVDMPPGWVQPVEVEGSVYKVWSPLFAYECVCDTCHKIINPFELMHHVGVAEVYNMHAEIMRIHNHLLDARTNPNAAPFIHDDDEEIQGLMYDLMEARQCAMYCVSCVQRHHENPNVNIYSRQLCAQYNGPEPCCMAVAGQDMADRQAETMANVEYVVAGVSTRFNHYQHCRVLDFDGEESTYLQPPPFLGPSYLATLPTLNAGPGCEFYKAPTKYARVGNGMLAYGLAECHNIHDGVVNPDHKVYRFYRDGTDRLRRSTVSRVYGDELNMDCDLFKDNLGHPLHISAEYYYCPDCNNCGRPRASVVVGPSWSYSGTEVERLITNTSFFHIYRSLRANRWSFATYPFRIAEMNNLLRRVIRNGGLRRKHRIVWISPIPPPLMRLAGQGDIKYMWRYDDRIVASDGRIVRQPNVFRAMWENYINRCNCVGVCKCGFMAIRFLSADFRVDNEMHGWEVLESPAVSECQMMTIRSGEEEFVGAHHVVRAYTDRLGSALYNFYIPISPTHFEYGRTIRGAWNLVTPPAWVQERTVNGPQYGTPGPGALVLYPEDYKINRVAMLTTIYPDLSHSRADDPAWGAYRSVFVVRRLWQVFQPTASAPGVSWSSRAINELDADIIDLNAGAPAPPGGRPPSANYCYFFRMTASNPPGHPHLAGVTFPVDKAHQVLTTLSSLYCGEVTYAQMVEYSRSLVSNNLVPQQTMSIRARDHIAHSFLNLIMFRKSAGSYSCPIRLTPISVRMRKTSFFQREMELLIGEEKFRKIVNVPYTQVLSLLFGRRHTLQLDQSWFRHGEDIAEYVDRLGLEVVWNRSGRYSHEREKWLFDTTRTLHLPWWLGWMNLTSDFNDIYERKYEQYCVPNKNRDIWELSSIFGKSVDVRLVTDSNVEIVSICMDAAWGKFKPSGVPTLDWTAGVNSKDRKRCIPCGGYAPRTYHWWCSMCPKCYEYRQKAKRNEPILTSSNLVQRGTLGEAMCFPPGNVVEVGGPLILPSVDANPKRKNLRGAFYHNGPDEGVPLPDREFCDCDHNPQAPVALVQDHFNSVMGRGPRWDYKPRKLKKKPIRPGDNPAELVGVGFPDVLPTVFADTLRNQMNGFKYRIMAQPVNDPNVFALHSARRLINRLMKNGMLFPGIDLSRPMDRMNFCSCRFLYKDEKASKQHVCSGPFCPWRHELNDELFEFGDDLVLYNSGLLFGDCWRVGWLDGMLPRRRRALCGGARDLLHKGELAFKASRFGSFVKRELAASRNKEFVLGVAKSNPRIIQGPPESSHVAAGPTLRVFTHELHDSWGFQNFITYVGGARPHQMRSYAEQNMNMDGTNKFPSVSYFMNDYSMFDSTYTQALFNEIVYPIYRFLGIMDKREEMDGRPNGKCSRWVTSAIRYWERPRGRLSGGIKYNSGPMNASGRDDTAVMNALINGLCIFFSILSYYYQVPMHHVDRITDDDISYISQRIHIAVLGDDSLVRIDDSLLRGDYEEFKTAMAQNVAQWGIEAKPQMEKEFRRAVFLGNRPYPCDCDGKPAVLWGPTIGRRLYKMCSSSELQPRPAEWLYSVLDATYRTSGHVPILRDTCVRIMKLLSDQGVALHEYTEERYRSAESQKRKGGAFAALVEFGDKVTMEPNKYTYQMVQDVYGITQRDIGYYSSLLGRVRRVPVLIRDPIINRVFEIDDL